MNINLDDCARRLPRGARIVIEMDGGGVRVELYRNEMFASAVRIETPATSTEMQILVLIEMANDAALSEEGALLKVWRRLQL